MDKKFPNKTKKGASLGQRIRRLTNGNTMAIEDAYHYIDRPSRRIREALSSKKANFRRNNPNGHTQAKLLPEAPIDAKGEGNKRRTFPGKRASTPIDSKASIEQ